MIPYKSPYIGLNDKEYTELITLEYVLTWHYTNNLKKDIKRYMQLQEKKSNRKI